MARKDWKTVEEAMEVIDEYIEVLGREILGEEIQI